MNKTTTLIMTLLMSVSLIGQTVINERPLASHKSPDGRIGIDLKTKVKNKLIKEPAFPSTKSSFAIKHRLDSAITEYYNAPYNKWDPDEKEELSYYANGKLNLNISYNWTGKSGWEPVYKNEITYNASGNYDLYNRYEWNAPYSNWNLVYKIEYSYDANNNLIQEVCTENDGTTWYTSWKIVNTYNGNNQITSDTNYLWDYGSSTLMPNSYNDYSYNANNDLITIIYYYYYQSKGWMVNMKSEYTYDANNYLSQILIFNWDDQLSQWKESYKSEFTVNSIGNVIEEIFYLYDYFTSQWNNNFKSVYGYDFSSNPINEEYFLWNDNKSQWEGLDKYNYAYNVSYTLNDLMIPPLNFFWPDYYELIHSMPLEMMNYIYDGSWKMDMRIRYHYSEHDVGINEISGNYPISIFPNPAFDFVTIRIDNSIGHAVFTLTDMQGRAVLQKSVAGDETIVLNHLPGSLYFFTISVNNEIRKTGKLMVE